MEETTSHPVFQPHRIQMSTVVVASHTPLVAGKEILNEHIVKSSSVVNEHTVESSLALNEHTLLVNEHTIESSSLGHFNSILYTSTEPHNAAEDR